jgi:hypothetical protein
MTTTYDFSVNPQFTTTIVQVGQERQPVLVVDEFLRDPESMARYAVQEAQFSASPVLYPGVVAPTPVPYVANLGAALATIIEPLFGVKYQTGRVVSNFYALVTLPPEQLKPLQRLPHADGPHPGQIAILHYLCDSSQGGTAFYRFRPTGWESLDAERWGQLPRLIEQDVALHGRFPARYPGTDERLCKLYEETARFEAHFNRLLVYRSRVLHSGLIGPQTILDPNPRVGRLTTNTFVQFDLA